MAHTVGANGNGAAKPQAGETPLVSIVIPVHNRADLTRQCLDSLFAHADPGIRTELLLIDDCSSDETPEYLRSLGERVRVFRNEQRRCFGHNMNFAASKASGKYLCLLNNDTYVSTGWLRKLVDAAERDPAVGVVGNKHLFPDSGKINHAGMVFDDNGCPTHLYPGLDADYAASKISREFQTLTAACWLVPRDLFLEMGGFDDQFRNGYEDVDFCLRARERGRKVYYCADSVIYHYGQSSPGRTDNDAANAAYFQKKWQGKIRPDLRDYLARDERSRTTPNGAAPARDADVHFGIPLASPNSFTWVTSQLALALDEIGVGVSIKPGKIDPSVGPDAKQRLRAMMRRPASRRVHIKWNHYWDPYLREEVSGEVNAEIFVTNYLYGKRPLHEVDYWMRHAALGRNRKLPISRFCQDALTELGVPEERCAVLPLGYSPEILEVKERDPRFQSYGYVILAITNSHDPYRYGTDLLLDAYGKAFKASDDVVLVLKDYGKGADSSLVAGWLDRLKKGPRVIHLAEFVDKADLIKLYRAADCFVAPFRGEGFGMKILDACAAGVPVLSPIFGGPADYLRPELCFPLKYREVPVGECYDRQHGILPDGARWVEVDTDDLAAQFRAVFADRNEARKRARDCQEFALREFSWRKAAESLRDTLRRFEGEREQVVGGRQLRGPSSKKITVVIPTYNRPDALQLCLAAFQKQTLPTDQWEMILVDDGSPYDVTGLVNKNRGRLPLTLKVNRTNAGPAKVRNHGIEAATGELVLFTGDDITPEPDFLAEHLAVHRSQPSENVAVLGYTYWHPEITVTPLMEYMTGEGGQQFCYDALKPNSFIPFSCFYTSNVSIKRSLLIDQEEMFSTCFPHAAFEDVELALRLARRGMKLWYHPKARAGHYHPMTDRQAFDRQYKVGRMLVTYALLCPEQIVEEHRVFLRWLDILQHRLLKEPGFAKVCADLTDFGPALQHWLDRTGAVAHGLTANLIPDDPDRSAADGMLAHEGKHWTRLRKLVYAYQFDFAHRSGMADEWMGVAPGAPNPAREFIRFYLCTGIWDLLGRGAPEAPLPKPTSKAAGRMLRIAHRVRQHPWLVPLWSQMKRLPGYQRLKGATKRMLHMLS